MEKVVKGDAFYLNTNHRKNKENQPDFTGKLIITHEQLRALIMIHERATEQEKTPNLQVDLSGWKGTSKSDGSPYLYCKSEIYTPERNPDFQPKPKKFTRDDDDWL
tara:strand:+ start:210 stop:527 length:318 start_codon:yes stop_codon:yes gene_type:complete